jgi:hypothetical protein
MTTSKLEITVPQKSASRKSPVRQGLGVSLERTTTHDAAGKAWAAIQEICPNCDSAVPRSLEILSHPGLSGWRAVSRLTLLKVEAA